MQLPPFLQLTIYLVALFSFSALSIRAQESPSVLVLSGATVIDGVSGAPTRDATLVIRDGKIAQFSTGTVEVPAGARVIDLGGRYLIPGLIDAHVHLRDGESARRALLSGVTTARSMGVAHFVDVGLRELAAIGAIDAPEILAAGYHVRPEPDEGFFLDFPELHSLMADGIHGEAAIRAMSQAMTTRGVDWIKVNATARAGLPQTDPREPYYSQSEMEVLTAADVPVAAHAHGDQGGRAAVLAGVRSIEHGTYLSRATLELMVERNVFLVPTIAVVADLTQPGGDYDQPLLQIRGRHMLPRVRQMAATARQLGVRIAAGTDTGYGANSTLRMGQELEELVGVGFKPLEALQAATSVAAELLNVDDHTGRIAPGLDADLIVIEGNPLEDIGAVNDPLLIINNGKIVLNRMEW